MTTATLLKESISLGLAYSFSGLVHYHRGREHGGTQLDVVLGKQLRSLGREKERQRQTETGPRMDF